MKIERINAAQYAETSAMIDRSVRSPAFASFYPACSLDYVAGDFDPESVRELAQTSHSYVIVEDGRVVGCGSICPLGGKEDESCLRAIFIDPAYQGRSYGRQLIETLERDEYFTRARRIEVSSSMPAVPFYRRLGYEHKNNDLIYDDGQILLEKFNM